MASATENNTLIYDRVTKLDLKMIKDGIVYREKCGWFGVFKADGVELSILSRTWFHMRSIGDRTYTENLKLVEGVRQETIDTNLAPDEVAEFKRQFTVAFQSIHWELDDFNYIPGFN